MLHCPETSYTTASFSHFPRIPHFPHPGAQAEVVVRHTTDFNIRCMRFSTYEEDQLVACGRDSVRMYRLKAGQLRGVSVRLQAPDRRVSSAGGGRARVWVKGRG